MARLTKRRDLDAAAALALALALSLPAPRPPEPAPLPPPPPAATVVHPPLMMWPAPAYQGWPGGIRYAPAPMPYRGGYCPPGG